MGVSVKKADSVAEMQQVRGNLKENATFCNTFETWHNTCIIKQTPYHVGLAQSLKPGENGGILGTLLAERMR